MEVLVSGWDEWAANLARLFQSYQRPTGVYGMITNEEMSFLEDYARYSYTGSGKIVDLGCWLGASTLSLARGLASNATYAGRQAIDAFDCFEWQVWMTPIAQAFGIPKVYKPGDSFLEDTEATLRAHLTRVRLHRKDLLKLRSFAEPVEFLFVDAMKSWPLANAISRTFFPRLLPQRSLVVQQDFAHHHPVSATNHVLMWKLKDSFQPVYHVPRSCSMVYFYTKPLTRRELPKLDPAELTPDEVRQAWEHSLRYISRDMWPSILLCKLLFMIEQGWGHEARAEAENLRGQGYRYQGGLLEEARGIIAERRSQLPARSPLAKVLQEIEQTLG
jgi:hypothetical protein